MATSLNVCDRTTHKPLFDKLKIPCKEAQRMRRSPTISQAASSFGCVRGKNFRLMRPAFRQDLCCAGWRGLSSSTRWEVVPSSVSARVVLSGAFQDRFAQYLLQGLCRFRAGACASRELVEDSGAASCTEQYVPCGD